MKRLRTLLCLAFLACAVPVSAVSAQGDRRCDGSPAQIEDHVPPDAGDSRHEVLRISSLSFNGGLFGWVYELRSGAYWLQYATTEQLAPADEDAMSKALGLAPYRHELRSQFVRLGDPPRLRDFPQGSVTLHVCPSQPA